jgi:BsuBI/PstI restriction endonuclease domain
MNDPSKWLVTPPSAWAGSECLAFVGSDSMGLEEDVRAMRKAALDEGTELLANQLQGVTRERIVAVLGHVDRAQEAMVDTVLVLLDDQRNTWWAKMPDGTKICHGATTAHIGAYIGILKRGKAQKHDREQVRDYWVKPLIDVGAVEAVQVLKGSREIVPGHPITRSALSGYRLTSGFVELLKTPEDRLEEAVEAWGNEDSKRERLAFQADVASSAAEETDNPHERLVVACRDHYAPQFLPGFRALFVDVSDGDYLSHDDRVRLSGAGLDLGLDDPKPDLLLWNPTTDAVWIVEAVKSDGEVNEYKAKRFREWALRYGKSAVGFTTAYLTWKDAANRQSRERNIAVETYIWILEDGSKHYLAETFNA